MDIKSMAIEMVMQQLGGADESNIGAALGSLLGGGEGGEGIELGNLVSQLSSSGLGDALSSWLGDGGNEQVSATQITGALGADKVAQFASELGVDPDAAANSLSNILPALIDQNSSGGSLISGVAGLASKLFD